MPAAAQAMARQPSGSGRGAAIAKAAAITKRAASEPMAMAISVSGPAPFAAARVLASTTMIAAIQPACKEKGTRNRQYSKQPPSTLGPQARRSKQTRTATVQAEAITKYSSMVNTAQSTWHKQVTHHHGVTLCNAGFARRLGVNCPTANVSSAKKMMTQMLAVQPAGVASVAFRPPPTKVLRPSSGSAAATTAAAPAVARAARMPATNESQLRGPSAGTGAAKEDRR
mmetsp:Transcript_68202/g.177056  ORF Transcript_68202/g.177056 Transcript_68202/m.177056 type:complete len:227 (+) Transcript_68202:974-1654(+)